MSFSPTNSLLFRKLQECHMLLCIFITYPCCFYSSVQVDFFLHPFISTISKFLFSKFYSCIQWIDIPFMPRLRMEIWDVWHFSLCKRCDRVEKDALIVQFLESVSVQWIILADWNMYKRNRYTTQMTSKLFNSQNHYSQRVAW